MTCRLIVIATLSTLVVPALNAADVQEFRKVDGFVTDGGEDEKKRDARLEIDADAGEIRLVDEKRGMERAVYAVIPIDQVTALAYSVEEGSRWGGIVGTRPRTHWLTIRADALQQGALRMRLDKDNQQELRFALRAVTGLVDDLAFGR